MTDLEPTLETYERVATDYAHLHGDDAGNRQTGRNEIAALLAGFEERLPDRGPVLDAGCGPGWELETLARQGHEVLGLDPTLAFCSQAASRVPGRVLRGDMRNLPVGSGTLGGIWAFASLLHVPREHVDETVAEFARVLQPDGPVTLSVKEGDGVMSNPDSPYESDDREFTLFGRDELRTRLGDAGFSVDVVDTNDDWLVVHALLAP